MTDQLRIDGPGLHGSFVIERSMVTAGGLCWSVVDRRDDRESAEDLLAVMEGRMTKSEAAKRWVARRKQSRQAA